MKKLSTFHIAAIGLLVLAGSANADQQILDDLIVDGSACVGQDCVNGESFGFDTIRLKENNLRIKFQDTSTSASFPSNDWQITANDSSNGGANKFSIDDITGGRTPFTLEAGAPSHSLFVDDGGRVGLGTNSPVVELHIKNGDSPTLRLEQDGSSGFTPQTWDVAGNESNFFVRDATNGSQLPFKIFPSAPTNALTVEGSTGDIGVGIQAPAASLHVRRSNGNAAVRIEEVSSTLGARGLLSLVNNGGSYITMENTATTESWFFTHENSAPNDFLITKDGDPEFRLDSDGDITIAGTITTVGGTCGGGCDLVFSDEYALESIEEHASLMWTNKHLPNVGQTIENQPFNLSEKTGGMLNELEKAHIYIEQLNNRLKSKETELTELKQNLGTIEQRLASLEDN